MIENIQQLFGLIPAASVLRYLEQRGWRREESADAAWAQYFSPTPDDEAPSRVSICTSETHPQYRRLLPNVIFTLAVYEQREALDIANEMFATRAGTAEGTTATPSRPQRLVLRQARLEISRIWVAPTNATYLWAPGERLELLVDGRYEPPALAIRDDAVHFEAWRPDEFRAFLVSPRPGSGAAPSVGAIVREELDRLSDFEFSGGRDACRESLAPTLDRIDFDLPLGADGAVSAETMRRQAARVAAAVAKQLRTASTSQAALWRILQRLVGLAGLGLEFDAWTLEAAWLTALDDSPEFPRETLRWLERRAADVDRTCSSSPSASGGA